MSPSGVIARVLFVAFALLLGAGCAVNPVTGKREFSLVSAEQELALGREGFGAVVSEYGVLDDAALTAYVDSIGQQLARRSELPNLAWRFTVLDDPVVNAFAMPGGYIYVTRGILAHLQSEAQLAGVLGHEIGHVTARHSARQITQQQLAGLGIGLASVLSEDFRRYSATAEQGLGLLLLKYGRDDENQADALGVRYSVEAGWDPREMPGTYATLRRIGERAGQRLPTFLSSHPDPGDREVRVTQLARTAATGRSGLAVRQRAYLERLRGLTYGEDPRHGYFEDGRFHHPTMGFEWSVPAGWSGQNGRSAVLLAAPEKRGALQLALAADARSASPAEYVAALQREGRISAARGAGESVGGWSAWVGKVTVPSQQGAGTTLVAGFVRQTPERMLQFLGQGQDEAAERQILAAIRSLRPLSDPARSRAVPARLRVVAAPAAGPFRDVHARVAGAQNALPVAEAAVLNGVEPEEAVQAGVLLKVVDPARRR